jgi:acyl-coenzyme A synthetase/AMP-(fatty) acid ligase
MAECDGEFIRILGRENDLINVAGRKVFPAEVEGVISEVENVSEVVVYGEPNAITGNIVCARIRLSAPEDEQQALSRIQRYCQQKLENHKVPVKLSLSEKPLHGERFKLDRVSRSESK